MHLNFNRLSGLHCRSKKQGPVERNSDNILVIYDVPAGAHMRTFSWIMVAAILVIGVFGAIKSQNVFAVIMLILVLLASISFIARRIVTKIDLSERTIGRTLKIGVLAWHRVYFLDDYVTAEIKVKGQVIEGYSLPFFSLNLAGTGGHIRIYSTDDANDAAVVYGAVTDFLVGTGYRHKNSKPDNI